MTTLIKKLISKLEQQPKEEREQYAAAFIKELDAEEKWNRLFADPRSEQVLDEMAAEAIEEDENKETEPLGDLLQE